MLLPFALVIIPVAAKSLQSNLLKCENTNYYRTRFHPEYYKDSLSQFHKVTEDYDWFQPALSLEFDKIAVKRFLKAFNVILPFRADGEEQYLLHSAQRLKFRSLKLHWSNEDHRKILCDDSELAEEFAETFLENIMGNHEELRKPLFANTRSRSEFIEPAWDSVLDELYQYLEAFYLRLEFSSALFRAITTRKYLWRLALLLQSPDEKERTSVSELYISLVTRISEESPEMSHSELKQSSRITRVVGSILQGGLYDAQVKQDEISIRAVNQLLQILSQIVQLTQDTDFESLFEEILKRQAIPLINILPYAEIHKYFSGFIQFHLESTRRVGLLKAWDVFASILLKFVYKSSKAWSKENDATRLDLLIDLYCSGNIPPTLHVTLFRLLFTHSRQVSRPELQLLLFRIMHSKKFMVFFEEGSHLYHSESVQLRVLREILGKLFLWYLEEKFPVWDLVAAVSAWIAHPRTKTLGLRDEELQLLLTKVSIKISKDVSDRFGDLTINDDDSNRDRGDDNRDDGNRDGGRDRDGDDDGGREDDGDKNDDNYNNKDEDSYNDRDGSIKSRPPLPIVADPK